MKPLSSKPSDACGADPISGFGFLDDSGDPVRIGGDVSGAPSMVPLCGDHLQEWSKGGLATAVNLGDKNSPRNKAMSCFKSLGKRVPVAPPPPVAKPSGGVRPKN